MLDDREPEACAARGASSIAAIEALEESRQLGFGDTAAVVRNLEDARSRRERQRRAGTRVSNRVDREVLDDHVQHAPAERQRHVRGLHVDPNPHVGALRAVGEPVADLLEHRQRRRRAERNHLAPALELRQEEHVVDELAHLLDLLACLGDQPVLIRIRKRRRVEQRKQARERRSQLVGHCGGETDAKLLVGSCLLHPRIRVWPRS